MALWTGLGQAATVAQLFGADIGGLISMIMQAALTARQNRKECEQLARRVFMIAELLPHLQDPEEVRQLAELGDTLRDAHEIVVSCQGKSAVYQLVTAGRQAERFREVQSKIDFYLILFPVISHIGVTRRLDRIYNTLVQDDSATLVHDGSARVEPSPISQSSSQSQLQEVAQEVLLAHGVEEFTLEEILAATSNFALDNIIGSGGTGTVYRGSLDDGQEVAVKRISDKGAWTLDAFHWELDTLSPLRHKHIIPLFGWCVAMSTRACKPGGASAWRRKEPERLIVYKYMENGSLCEHLNPHGQSSSSAPVRLSPVTVSWKMRIKVLLGVSLAIEHLHCYANPPIIHRDIKSANILLDASLVPRLSDFGMSVAAHMDEETCVCGTFGYVDPEYAATGRVKRSSDLYSLGVVMLEVLTGEKVILRLDDNTTLITDRALPIIEAGNLGELLDKRNIPAPTQWQLQALEQVAKTAVHCVQMEGKDRPAISEVVDNLEVAMELMCRDEPRSASVKRRPVTFSRSQSL